MKEISSRSGVEQPKSDNALFTRLWPLKWIAITTTVLATVVALPFVVVVVTKEKKSSESQWRDVSPIASHINVTHTAITGVWSDLLVIAGTASADISGRDGVVEFYKRNDNKLGWIKQSQLVTQGTIIAAMAVSLQGNRIAICAVSPLRFIVYEDKSNNGEWKQYGESIHQIDILPDNNKSMNNTNFDEELMSSTPNIMLSDDGRIFAISLSTKSTEGFVQAMIDVNSLGGTIGGVWKLHGISIQSGQSMDSSFAKYTAMDGSGQKILVSGNGTLSLYEWSDINNGNKSTWELTAEYDESPLPESGSIALSKDGSTTAIGSFKGRDTVDGSGELYILNDVWPWFNYNDNNPWFLESGNDGPDYDHQSAGKVQVSLSSKGDYVLVGRERNLNNINQMGSFLQVYHFDTDRTEWISHGLPFGSQEYATTHSPQHIDISDDGTTVATAVLGKIFVYTYM
jgi:hypothetical protein